MFRLSHILLLTALSAGPGMLCAQTTEPVTGQDKENPPKEERRFGPPPGPDGRPPGDWGRGRGGRDGGRDGRDGRGSRSPMDELRRLLALSPEERETDLAGKSEWSRNFMLGKLKEYDALTPEQRELRLSSTELYFEMLSLLRSSPDRRAEKLERLPEDRRKAVQARLDQWDKLPPDLQQDVLEHQSTIRYVIRVEAAPAASKEDVFANMSPEYREKVKTRIDEMKAWPKEQRNRMVDAFHNLFELSDHEQQAILEKLNQNERAKVEQTLADYEKLSPDERKRCMDSARKFNNLSADEQARFIATAERWEKMSEEERNTWRSLVKQMPPLPPGAGAPPLPPGSKPGVNPLALPTLPPAPKD